MGSSPDADEASEVPPRIIRLRIVPADVICTVALLVVIIVAAAVTNWWPTLFGFLDDVCVQDDCPPAPYGLNYFIYPVVWGGLGAAIAAALIGPVVSLLKGWYLCFWMLIAVALVLLSALLGSLMDAVVSASQ